MNAAPLMDDGAQPREIGSVLMLRNKLSFLLASSLCLSFAACDDGDDGGDTGADGTESAGTESATTDTPTTDSSTTDGPTTDTPTTDTPDTDTSDDSSTTDDSAGDPCEDVTCDEGQSCVGGICVDDVGETEGETDSGGEGCPAGETCEMTGAGGMACLGAPSHCVLACGAGAECPATMECQAGACQYNVSGGLPQEQDAIYPLAMECPEGYFMQPVAFAMGFGVCAPECDRADMCPAAETGTAVGVCAFNPTSSGDAC